MTERRISKREFVIRPAPGVAAKDVESVLGSKVSLEPLKSGIGGFVAKLESPSGDAREAWERLHTILGERAEVVPALLDEQGAMSFPTGRVTVRFADPLSDDELARFAEEHGLDLVRRTPFVRNQAAFAPHERGVFLPELCEQIASDVAVVDAWLDAESAYQRGAS